MPTPVKVPHVVIVGAGFAGLNVAKGLSGAPCRVTVVDRSNHHLFQPLLYQVATAGLSPADIAMPIRTILKSSQNVEVQLADVVGVALSRGEARFSDGVLSYDFLILATGSRYNYFGHPEWEEWAPSLKSLGDATRIRQKILLAFEAAEAESDLDRRKQLLTFVIVGGGPTGVEMAGAIAELAHKALASDFRKINPASARILLVEGAPKILNAFPDSLAAKAKVALEKLGVEVWTSAAVESIDADGAVVRGERIHARTVLWAAGVLANPVAKWLGVKPDRIGRVEVAGDLSVPGHPNVFVIGDAALVKGAKGAALPSIAPVAMQEGEYVARRILGKSGTESFAYRNKGNLATVGRSFAICDFGSLRLSGGFGWIVWLLVHIFYLIGYRNRLLVIIQWAWAYATFQRGARLIYPREI